MKCAIQQLWVSWMISVWAMEIPMVLGQSQTGQFTQIEQKLTRGFFFYSSRCKSWQKSPGFPQKNSQMRGWNGELNPSIASTSMWFQFCYARYFYLVSILKKTCSTPKASSKVLCCYVMFCFLCPPNKYWYQSGGDLKEKIFPQTLRFYPRTTHHPPRCMPPWRTLKPKQFNLWEDRWGVQKNQQRRTLYGLKSITFWSNCFEQWDVIEWWMIDGWFMINYFGEAYRGGSMAWLTPCKESFTVWFHQHPGFRADHSFGNKISLPQPVWFSLTMGCFSQTPLENGVRICFFGTCA